MKAHMGGLQAYLNKNTRNQTYSENGGQVNLTWIDVRDIVPNENNFYGIRDVEELAAMMAASTNYVEPLVVTPIQGEAGKFRLVAGDRRRTAVMLRLERGDIADPKVPCIVKYFNEVGKLTAEDMEMLCLIVSNKGQRQTKTVYEKLQEIEYLEPIARKIYEDEKIKGKFRQFFANEILSISSGQIHRLKMIYKLAPEAKKAMEEGKLSESSAIELAARTAEDQKKYIADLRQGKVVGSVSEIQRLFPKNKHDTSPEVTSTIEMKQNEMAAESPESANNPEEKGKPEISLFEKSEVRSLGISEQNHKESSDTTVAERCESLSEPIKDRVVADKPSSISPNNDFINKAVSAPYNKRPLPKSIINIDTPFPEDLSGDKAEREADEWITKILADSIKFAEAKMKEARAEGRTKEAALWDSRRAKAVLVLQTVQD